MSTEPPSSPEAKALAKAHANLCEKVSIVGWKEALSEEVPWIRWVFMIVLVFSTVCCVYYSNQSMFYYFQHSGYKDEITDFSSELDLPFSNVTICAQLNFNETYVRNRLNISQSIVQSFINQSTRMDTNTNMTEDDFYRLLTLYLTPVMRMRGDQRNLILENHLRKIIPSSPELYDYSDFVANAYPSCEKMLKQCSIDGREFDCCSNALQSVSDDGICYLIVLNMDSDNAFPANGTVRLNRAGPSGGLMIEAETELREFPMLDSDADNGYSVFVDATPYTVVLSPALAPSFSETFVKVTPSKRILGKDCAARGHLMPGIYHDPEGYVETSLSIEKLSRKYLGCDFVQYVHRPNSSRVCDPYRMLIISYGISVGSETIEDYKEKFLTMGGNSKVKQQGLQMLLEEVQEAYNKGEDEFKALANLNSLIPKHCVRWTYETSPSFFDLETDHPRKDIMYSRIRIYYGDLAYRQYEQVPEFTVYLQFCELSNLMALYWGTSAVSFVHIIYYLSKYWWAWRKWKISVRGVRTGSGASRGSAQIKLAMGMRTIKVAPIRSDLDDRAILEEQQNPTGFVVRYMANRNARVSVISQNMRV